MQQWWSEDFRITPFHLSDSIYRSAVVEAGATALLAVITVSSRIKYTVLYTSYHKVLPIVEPMGQYSTVVLSYQKCFK